MRGKMRSRQTKRRNSFWLVYLDRFVEDDYFVALELEHCLDQAGYDEVGVATTADKALTLA